MGLRKVPTRQEIEAEARQQAEDRETLRDLQATLAAPDASESDKELAREILMQREMRELTVRRGES